MRLGRKRILFAIWTCNVWVWRPQELSPQSKKPWFHSFAIYSNLFKNVNLYAKLKSLAAVINVSKLAIKFNLIQIMTLDVIYCKRDTKLKVSKSQKQFFLKLHCPEIDLNFWQISALASKMGQIKKNKHTLLH